MSRRELIEDGLGCLSGHCPILLKALGTSSQEERSCWENAGFADDPIWEAPSNSIDPLVRGQERVRYLRSAVSSLDPLTTERSTHIYAEGAGACWTTVGIFRDAVSTDKVFKETVAHCRHAHRVYGMGLILVCIQKWRLVFIVVPAAGRSSTARKSGLLYSSGI